METEMRIIEINGVKLEVDLRLAKTVASYKVGDMVKVLIKRYGDTFESYPGMIVGFDNFVARPTLVVAYITVRYGETNPLQFAYINADSKDVELCPMVDNYITIEKTTVLEAMDRDILKREQEIADQKVKRAYFLKHFNRFFSEMEGVS